MTRGRLAAAVAFLACALALPVAPAEARAVSPESREMVGVINRTRAKHGRAPLRISPSLLGSARRYGGFMLAHDFFGHLSRIRASSAFQGLGEALAYHRGWRPRIRSTVRGWLRSPSHNRLVLSSSYRYLGAARRRGHFGSMPTTVWVLQVGRYR